MAENKPNETHKTPAGKAGDERDTGHSGAHAAKPGEAVKSRSADPGQSSYGGFSNEDPRHQAQQIDPANKEKGSAGADKKSGA